LRVYRNHLSKICTPGMNRPYRRQREKSSGAAITNAELDAGCPDKLSGEPLTTSRLRTKVLVVQHSCWIRRAVRNVIDKTERFVVCAETDTAQRAMALFEQWRPKIVVLDLMLGQGGGINLIKALIKIAPGALILVLSSDDGVTSICRALRAGAVGYLSVDDGDSELPIALDAIACGAYYVSKTLWTVVLKSFAHTALRQMKAGANLLTDREFEVFTLIGRGAGISETAEKLGVSVKTVETHQMRIKRKLKLGSAAELKKYALHSMSGVVRH